MTAAGTGSLYLRILRASSVYVALAILGTASLFALHYWGNLLPFELAKQRFAYEFATTNRLVNDSAFVVQRGVNRRFYDPWEYCQISTIILAGALRDGEEPSLANAVMLPSIPLQHKLPHDCAQLFSAASGVEFREFRAKPRYSWGSKALFAIFLSQASVATIHRFIRVATWGAYALLAGALWLAGWRVFAVATPFLIFAFFFSGLRWMSDVGAGIPHAWAIFAGAAFAWLVARRSPGSALRLFCFIAGMVSSWFWFFDGHEIILITLIGLIGWFGLSHLEPRVRLFRVAGFIALYLGGFVVCFSLVQFTKMLVYEMLVAEGVHRNPTFVTKFLFRGIRGHLLRIWEEFGAGVADPGQLPILGDWRFFLRMSPLGDTATWILMIFSVLALPAAWAALALLPRGPDRGRIRADLLWLAGLLLVVIVHFALPDDLPFRRSRYIALLLALSWSALIVAGLEIAVRYRSQKPDGALSHGRDGAPPPAPSQSQGGRKPRRRRRRA